MKRELPEKKKGIEGFSMSTLAGAFILFFLLSQTSISGQDTTRAVEFSNPASVSSQLSEDTRPKKAFINWYFLDSLDEIKKRFYNRSGFTVNADYNSGVMVATNAIGNTVGASGVFRLYGKWNFVGRGTPHEGGLIFKVENRHRYTENPLREYSLLDVGFGGLMQSVYSDMGWGVTNLYWRQTIGGQDKAVIYAGFVDVTDWTDIYAVASPWQSFQNLVFATGSGTVGGLYPFGALGLMANVWLSKEFYVIGGLIDPNGDPTRFWEGFETLFTRFETLKTLEFGYTPNSLSTVFLKNVHIVFWQVDKWGEGEFSNGWGVAGSASWMIGNFLPFLRAGWAKDGVSFYEASVSAGFAYNIAGPNTLGVGLNWNRPNANTYGTQFPDQYVSEFFYKLQLTHHSELTPNIQLIGNPAFNPGTNFLAVFGLRFRAHI